MENGTRYWEEVFKRFPNMRYFVPKRRISMVVDFQEQDKIDYFSERVRLDSMVEADPDFLKKRMSAGNAVSPCLFVIFILIHFLFSSIYSHFPYFLFSYIHFIF